MARQQVLQVIAGLVVATGLDALADGQIFNEIKGLAGSLDSKSPDLSS
ncbi:hypothetical protein [Pelagibius marinus]|nr:hypothetical protein [Pelagibius marinus]